MLALRFLRTFKLLGYLIINTKSDGTPFFILHTIIIIQQKNSYY